MSDLFLSNSIIAMNELIIYNIPFYTLTFNNFIPNIHFHLLINNLISYFNLDLIELENRFNGYSILKFNNFYIIIRYFSNFNDSYNILFNKFYYINDVYDFLMPNIPHLFRVSHFEKELHGPIEDN